MFVKAPPRTEHVQSSLHMTQLMHRFLEVQSANYPTQIYMFIKEIDIFICYYTGIVMCNNKYVTAVNFSQI